MQLEQQIKELPFLHDPADELPPIKREFLCRVRQVMSPEDKRLFDVTYAQEHRTMAEQAEILRKSLRAHTIQKNRFFAKLHSVRQLMASELLREISSPDRILLGPDSDVHNAIVTLGVTDFEKTDFKLAIAVRCTHNCFCYLASEPACDKGLGSESPRAVIAKYTDEAWRFLRPQMVNSQNVQDLFFRGSACLAAGRLLCLAGLRTELSNLCYMRCFARASAMFRMYGDEQFADNLLAEGSGFMKEKGLHFFDWLLPRYSASTDLSEADFIWPHAS